VTMRASLAAPRVPALRGEPEARPLLDVQGARVLLGAPLGVAGVASPIAPTPATMFGPRGACLAAPRGPLFVADTGHHRVLGWRETPRVDHTPADLVLGQPDFLSEGRNARGEVSATTLNVPTGIAAAGGVLAIADAWNHRVLLWHQLPTRSNQPPDVVLGQRTFAEARANRGASSGASATTLNWCYGVAIGDGRLFVADTGNRRVLVWDRIPETNGAAADRVLGQRELTARDENAGASPGSVGMRWPHGIAFGPEGESALLVSDAGNNRVMVWRAMPAASGTPCDFVLGQRDAVGVDHNQAAYYPTAAALNMPYALAVQGQRLLVADTANSRLLGFDLDTLAMNRGARFLAGQTSFANKGDNRWGEATRDSVCWPYGLAVSGDTVVVADAGNNRVLLWSGEVGTT
jgi:hypothetical protein